MRKEFSAGGVITKDGKILMVLMNTITGRKVWTFPKGHIEEGETPQKAALREVFEETGVKCEITDEKEFYVSHYFFNRNGQKVEKKVFWYIMRPVEDSGEIQTPDEIEEIRWADFNKALEMAEYESDREIIKKIDKIGGKNGI